jgi:phosphoribosyl 1,2-cyclic phosphate phosphodiesterase
MKVTFLGTGSSSGTPGVGIGWGSCDPAEPKNRRLRPSILVEAGGTRILVDTSPDLREQLLRAGVEKLDAVLYTHAHADHLHGIDDLRAVNRAMNARLPTYADEATLKVIQDRFGYVLAPLKHGATNFYKPCLDPQVIVPGKPFRVGAIEIMPFDQDHGFSRTLGFRFGPIAYSTDLIEMTDAAYQTLNGIRVWIVSTFGATPHPTHAHVDKTLGWIARVAPRRAILTHLSPGLDHASLQAKVPAGVEVGFDGMVVEA